MFINHSNRNIMNTLLYHGVSLVSCCHFFNKRNAESKNSDGILNYVILCIMDKYLYMNKRLVYVIVCNKAVESSQRLKPLATFTRIQTI